MRDEKTTLLRPGMGFNIITNNGAFLKPSLIGVSAEKQRRPASKSR